MKEKGYTVVPTRLFISERGWAKLEIALARGKKQHDKRESIKDRDVERDMRRDTD
jgi:SsrA-binding protein